jgi:DNA-3-methyladenine glycosylase
MVNVVTNKKDQAEAVLIRALQPLDGWNIMMKRMNTSTIKKITSGPGKLTKAMGIDQRHNSMNLIGDEIWIEDRGLNTPRSRIMASPRIGIDYAGEDAKLPWRFTLKENEWISR